MNEHQDTTLHQGVLIAHGEGLHRLGRVLKIIRQIGEQGPLDQLVNELVDSGSLIAGDLVSHRRKQEEQA